MQETLRELRRNYILEVVGFVVAVLVVVVAAGPAVQA
jgi:hypothetical protein